MLHILLANVAVYRRHPFRRDRLPAAQPAALRPSIRRVTAIQANARRLCLTGRAVQLLKGPGPIVIFRPYTSSKARRPRPYADDVDVLNVGTDRRRKQGDVAS